MTRVCWVAAGLIVLCAGIGTFALAGAQPDKPAQVSDRPAVATDVGERVSRQTEIFPDRPDVPPTVTVITDKVYGSPGGRDLHLDVFMRKRLPQEPRPAIVFIHGGSWKFGNKGQFRRQAAWLADRLDIFGACIEYRLSGEAQFPAALQDAKCAVRWVRSVADQYRIDPGRIAVCGGSAGGHLSAMMAVTNGIEQYEGNGGHADSASDVQLAILFNGEFDMWDLVERGSLIDAMNAFFGGTSEELPRRYDEASPIKRLTRETPPMLFLHGDQDTCVSHEQALAMVRRLHALGVPAEAEIYQNKPHAWFNKDPDWRITIQRVEPFLVKHLEIRDRPAPSPADLVTITPGEGKATVNIGGQLFTQYVYQGHTKPILYPILGPHGIEMTRHYPMKEDVDNEARDHPHQKSLWFTHGDVNGVNFWLEYVREGSQQRPGRIVQKNLNVVDATIHTEDDWIAPDGAIVCSDVRKIGFGTTSVGRYIDFEITIQASHGDVIFADTKEGTMGLRTHPMLRLATDERRGNHTAAGKAVNSEGTEGRDIWGQRAKWVDYWAPIGGKTVGIAIFDHPSNPRHPTMVAFWTLWPGRRQSVWCARL